eukprot:9296669-Pyramimonas_sp.AAC.1
MCIRDSQLETSVPSLAWACVARLCINNDVTRVTLTYSTGPNPPNRIAHSRSTASQEELPSDANGFRDPT